MRRLADPRLALPAISALAFVIVLLAWGLPWLTDDRTATTATPTPPAFQTITPVVLRPGAQACQSLVAFEPATRTATVLSAEHVTDGPPLRITARAGDWRASGDVDGGYGGYAQLQAQLAPPPGDALGEVCVRNVGDRRVALQGSTEPRVQTRSATVVDGRPVEPRMTLVLGQGAHRSLADRPGQILDRVAAFKPPIVGRASLALLALVVVLGVPTAVVLAVARGIAADD
ncbi:MAG TPA: hypothetical protein VFR97_04880 [Capillimicrobium sp.]|nr:hypothetical protein [Capillimicrobium sp.]